MSDHAFVNKLPKCDFHTSCTAEFDFKTRMGSWANGCWASYRENGTGLGTGLGQKLIVKEA